MEPKSERTPTEPPRPPEPPAPRKRFRIRKLEERIAPKQGGHKASVGCSVGNTLDFCATLNSCVSVTLYC